MSKPTETQTAIDNAIAALTVLRSTYGARADINYDDPFDLRALRAVAFDVANAVDPIFKTLAEAGYVGARSSIASDAVSDGLADDLTTRARDCEKYFDADDKAGRDDYAEHNTLFKSAQMGAR